MEFKTNCFSIITNYDETRLALKKIDSKFYLPHHDVERADEVFLELKKQTGLETTLLYFVNTETLEEQKTENIIIFSISEESELINDFHWVNINDLDQHFINHKFIEKWLNETRLKNFSVPWFNKDWFKQIKLQVKSILEKKGFQAVNEIKQYYISDISCVLTIQTEKGLIYCKSVLPPIFKNEPQITQSLYDYSPDYFPEVIFTDNPIGLIFTKDFGKEILSKNNDFSIWLKAAKNYARLQIEMIDKKNKLLNQGMFNRSIELIGNQLKDVLKMDDKIFLDQKDCITSEEVNKLISNFDQVENLIQQLQRYNIPETIEHGDMHPGNIAVKDNQVIFYDWSDCAISHPFISMRIFFWKFFDEKGNLKEKFENFPDINNSYNLLVDAYLNEWEKFHIKEDLKKAFEIAQKVAFISFTIQYVFLVDSMADHTKIVYKGHIAKGIRKILSFL